MTLSKERGASLIIFALVLVMTSTSIWLTHLNGGQIKNERDKKTIAALAEAKAALIGYSLKTGLNNSCSQNCARPGELPCPDMTNDGVAGSACANQEKRIGRFPWKTLGATDLRDGDGERLWYAVSNQYKYNPRLLLNSDSNGSVNVMSGVNAVLHDATQGRGAVAVVIAPGSPIVRVDGVPQSRDAANQNNPMHYLDKALSLEDNTDFIDSSSNGFIVGPQFGRAGQILVNDRVIVISTEDMLQPMVSQVLAEVKKALMTYFQSSAHFPNPASFDDADCLNVTITEGQCMTAAANTPGRIPAFAASAAWDSTIFRASSTGNWFQQNGWRELLVYAVAPACASDTNGCDGVGKLTVLNAVQLPENDKNAVLIASGEAIGLQTRTGILQKCDPSNYLEDENLNLTNRTFIRVTGPSAQVNDRVVSVP